ncbi:C4-dicarboxylate ABC transporter substrate-binding protein [Alkalilimnicola ehrlichii]|uniref:TRAP transporter small permease protein n=1 Tax=Alkalilimnicola ehrlichii TaxID=351052 RepID=A0A3E0WLN2_9GAMM|nr:TRAP transporter small permease subunit [Alkalilimnicola ehrlichii]RFA25878.1 C4-dicarboxylate ABC transporter substrate-binding protein [Alkalilimnicola ehrlichii]RFA33123.1 C4-dicarboxylate ABC transporter substrate-binding protein [Alkalilimnicola ehrlichii]
MQLLLLISRGIDAFTGAVGRLMGWAALLLVLIGVYNAITRYLGAMFGVQLAGNVWIETQTYLFNLIFLLGAAYLLSRDGHIRVDVLSSRFSARTRAWIDIVGTVFLLLPFCWLAIYYSWDYVLRSWAVLEQSPNPGGLPRYPIKTVIIVAFVLLMLQGVSEVIKRVAFLRGWRSTPTDAEGEKS